jgi:hypothetical protein
MTQQSNIKLTIYFHDPELEPEEREREVQGLFSELQEVDEIEIVARTQDPNPPSDAKAVGSFLIGLLTAEVRIENAKKLLGFLGNRLGGKPIELEVEACGKRLKVSAHSREELEVAIKAALDFVKG